MSLSHFLLVRPRSSLTVDGSLDDKLKLLQLQMNDLEPLKCVPRNHVVSVTSDALYRAQLASANADVEDAKRRLADSVAISKAEDERAQQKLADAALQATSTAKEHQIVVDNLKEFTKQLKSQCVFRLGIRSSLLTLSQRINSKDHIIKEVEERLAQSAARERGRSRRDPRSAVFDSLCRRKRPRRPTFAYGAYHP